MSALLRFQDCVQPTSATHVQAHEEKISLSVREGEILGLLGRSGTGKSSILNLMSGLASPVAGEIFWKEKKAHPKDFHHVATVLEEDALFPWLTVSENVRLGLASQKHTAEQKKDIAAHIIAIMDLDGYESAYPRELSEALRQRTALARALARGPELLLLDEPFLELELLSAENLRTDLVELWSERRLEPLKAMVLATHAIEEAVLMCDRILLFGGAGRITHEITVPFPHPRNREEASFRHFVDQIYALMTRRTPIVSEAEIPLSLEKMVDLAAEDAIVLPDISVEVIVGLLEVLGNDLFTNRVDLPELAQRLQMTLDDLFPLGETLQRLDLAELEDGDLLLTATGDTFVHGDADARRDIMRAALLRGVPLLRAIRSALDERPNQGVDAERFRRKLEEDMSKNNARQTLNTAISWGRYANLFGYDEEADRFLLSEAE